MRQLLILSLILAFGAFPAFAQTQDASVYSVSDVAVDVTADSAVHARDQAVTQAQRAAFSQLLERLGVDASAAGKLSDDDIATLVQSFELQSERASSVRYLGVYTVQFKPNAVKAYLGGRGATYTEQRSAPVVVLPVYENNHRPVLWEDSTRWRAAWDNVPHTSGLVPVIVPAGGLDDISVISTEEAVSGATESIKALIEKYQAGGAAVVTLKGNVDKPSNTFAIEIQRYTADGTALPTESLTVGVPDKNAVDAALSDGTKKTIHQFETDWKRDVANGVPAMAAQPDVSAVADPSAQNQTGGIADSMPESRVDSISVTVPITTLAQWTQIQRKIATTQGVDQVNVISLQRGAVSITIVYRGNLEDLQTLLLQRNLQLKEDTLSGAWFLNPF